jgi:hypothetical protein
LYIQAGGNIGIGTASSVGGGQPKLWSANDVTLVAGNYAGDVNAQIMAVGTTNPLKRLALMYDTTNNIGLVQAMIAGTGTSPLCLNAAGGNVGIGTTTPTTYTLQVTGSIGATADITAFTSDERLKFKTGPLVDALDKVCTLDTFTYTHNDLARSFGFTAKRQYVGISAQQVRKIQPEVVRIAPFDADGEGSKSGQEYITVQYERLVPLLIEALKEERKAREALEERIKLLEQK